MLIRCAECGREVSDSAAACPQCGCPVVAETKHLKCPECGRGIPDTVTTCPQCGCPIGVGAPAPQPSSAIDFGSSMERRLAQVGPAVVVRILVGVVVLGLVLSKLRGQRTTNGTGDMSGERGGSPQATRACDESDAAQTLAKRSRWWVAGESRVVDYSAQVMGDCAWMITVTIAPDPDQPDITMPFGGLVRGTTTGYVVDVTQ